MILIFQCENVFEVYHSINFITTLASWRRKREFQTRAKWYAPLKTKFIVSNFAEIFYFFLLSVRLAHAKNLFWRQLQARSELMNNKSEDSLSLQKKEAHPWGGGLWALR